MVGRPARLQTELANLVPGSEDAANLASEIFSLKLMRILAIAMLVLSAWIIVDAVRKWYGILAGQEEPVEELVRAE